MPATFSIYNLLVDRFLSFTPGPTAGWVLSINSDGSTNWISPNSGPQGATGPGFNTISNASKYRILIATNSSNSAYASPNLSFNENNKLGISGSIQIDSIQIDSTIFEIKGYSYSTLVKINDSSTSSIVSLNNNLGSPVISIYPDDTALIGNYSSPALYTSKKIILSTGSNIIYTVKQDYTSSFIDYYLSKDNNCRSGSINAAWFNNNIKYYEMSTLDVGNTSDVVLSYTFSGSYSIFNALCSSAGWELKTIIRTI